MNNAYALHKAAKDRHNNIGKNLLRLGLYGGGGALTGGLIGGLTNNFEDWNNIGWGAGLGGTAGLGLGAYLNATADEVDAHPRTSQLDEVFKGNVPVIGLVGAEAAGATTAGHYAGKLYNKARHHTLRAQPGIDRLMERKLRHHTATGRKAALYALAAYLGWDAIKPFLSEVF